MFSEQSLPTAILSQYQNLFVFVEQGSSGVCCQFTDSLTLQQALNSFNKPVPKSVVNEGSKECIQWRTITNTETEFRAMEICQLIEPTRRSSPSSTLGFRTGENKLFPGRPPRCPEELLWEASLKVIFLPMSDTLERLTLLLVI